MKIGKWLPLLVLFVSLTFTACRSSKGLVEGTPSGETNRQEEIYKKKIVANAQQADCVTAKLNLDIQALGKAISVDGRLRMKRNEVVQLSLSLLGFEVGRLEFTPQQVLVVDRVNKQFVRASYAEVDFLQQANVDFYALQSLFWNELFIPGQQDVKANLSRFKYEEIGNYALLSLLDTPKLVYNFQTQMEQAILNRVTVKGKRAGDEGQLEWTYDNFTRLDNRLFPTLMNCKVSGLEKELSLTFSLSRLDNDAHWSTSTNLSSRYKERRVEEILHQLIAL